MDGGDFVGKRAWDMGRREFGKAIALLPVLLANPFKGLQAPAGERTLAVLEAPAKLWHPGDGAVPGILDCGDIGFCEVRTPTGLMRFQGVVTSVEIHRDAIDVTRHGSLYREYIPAPIMQADVRMVLTPGDFTINAQLDRGARR